VNLGEFKFPYGSIRLLVGDLADADCVWMHLPTPMVGASGRREGRAWVELSYTGDRTVGQGDYRQWPSQANPDVLDTLVTQYALVTINLKAKSFEPEKTAQDILKRVRWRLRGVTAQAVYTAANIALVDVLPIAVYRGTAPGMQVRMDASMDVVFAMYDGGDPGDDAGLTFGQANMATAGVVPVTIDGGTDGDPT
jgi:hypothetical protein